MVLKNLYNGNSSGTSRNVYRELGVSFVFKLHSHREVKMHCVG